ncbi:MAG: TetR/AcrR family transcriptional regulator [Actinomycetia bacterium]|nr:TetR/AcrR family transcriptional regulator [Actinomycetes bacterium]
MSPAARPRGPGTEPAERIVAAAEDMVAAQGYTSTSIVAVAHRAGVATGSVYRHFPSKAELFGEVFRRCAGRELAAVRRAVAAADGAVAQLTAIVDTFARRALRGARLAWALLAEPVDPEVDADRLAFRRAYRDTIHAVLRAGTATGELDLGSDTELVAAALVGAIAEALVGPLSPITAGAVDPDRVVAELTAAALRLAGAPPPGREPGVVAGPGHRPAGRRP